MCAQPLLLVETTFPQSTLWVQSTHSSALVPCESCAHHKNSLNVMFCPFPFLRGTARSLHIGLPAETSYFLRHPWAEVQRLALRVFLGLRR